MATLIFYRHTHQHQSKHLRILFPAFIKYARSIRAFIRYPCNLYPLQHHDEGSLPEIVQYGPSSGFECFTASKGSNNYFYYNVKTGVYMGIRLVLCCFFSKTSTVGIGVF